MLKAKIKIIKNGPYFVEGNLPLAKEIIEVDHAGVPVRWEKGEKYSDKETYKLCRCGQSKNPPYCDGAHNKINFDGTETADHSKYQDLAKKIVGPDLILTDAEELCASARFCHRDGGTWRLTEESDDKHKKATAIQEACDCPSGRLVAWEKDMDEPIEPKFEPSIGLVEDPDAGASGPIWVKGNVPIEGCDGVEYEIRNRVTLCRCGKSKNKPFCDGAHIRAKFSDGDKSLSKKYATKEKTISKKRIYSD